jgi:amino acid transporter
MPLYVMYGFDTAGSLAEETSDPRRKAPRAVIQALLTAGIMGFLLIAFGIMAAKGFFWTAGGMATLLAPTSRAGWLAIRPASLPVPTIFSRVVVSLLGAPDWAWAPAATSGSKARAIP